MTTATPAPRRKKGWMSLKVTKIEDETWDTKTFYLEDSVDTGCPFDYIAGQYLTLRFDKIAEGFGCYGEYVEREEDIAPAIKRAYASGTPGVIHVAIDPKANSEEMPSYDEFRTWYAEGQQ